MTAARPVVLKFGGELLEDPGPLGSVVAAVARISSAGAVLENDALAVRAEVGIHVVSRVRRDLDQISAIRVHHVDVAVSIAP